MGAQQSVPAVDLQGKVAIVTGASAGIGLITAKELARMGAEVILACRNLEKAKKVQEIIEQETKSKKVVVMELNLASLKSVRKFAEEFKERKTPLHYLINNAGIMALPTRQTTEDGFEAQFGTNHLGHFLLTNLLLDVIKKSAPARIVNLSSMAHKMGQLDFDDLQLEKNYGAWRAYGNSKLANILFTKELQRRLEGTNVFTYAVHPGFVKTELARDISLSWAMPIANLFAKTPEQGAMTTLYCTVSPEVEGVGGKYYSDCRETQPTAAACDLEAAKKLWEVSEQLVGLQQS